MVSKITMVGTMPPLKGIAHYCTTLVEQLSKRIKVDFISFKKLYPEFLYPGGVENNNVKIKKNKNLKIRRIMTYYNPFSWLYAAFSAKTKVVHLQWWSIPLSPIYVTMMSILKLRGKKIVLTIHNVIPHEATFLDKWLTLPVYFLSDFFIVHAKNNKETLIKKFNIKEDKVHLVNMGILGLFSGKKISKSVAIKKLDLPKDKKIIINFGNIRDYKGVDDLIKAFSILRKKDKDAYLIIAGQPWGDFKKYDSLIKKYGLEKDVKTFLKYLSEEEVYLLFNASDLVVLPYKKFDAQSGVGSVALAFAKPMIVSNTGGLPDLVDDTSAISLPENPIDLAKKMAKVLNDKKLLKKLSTDSVKKAKEFSYDSIIKKTIEVYDGCTLLR